MSPSDASPSDAMTTQAFVPLARRHAALAAIWAVTSRICLHSGVRPVGSE